MPPTRSGDRRGDAAPSAGSNGRDDNAIGDFRRLELTLARVGFERADAPATDDADGDGSDSPPGGGYVEYAVDDRTVDLTRLRGPNAVRVASFDVPSGTYRRAVVYVRRARGTLRDGARVAVAPPDGPLEVARRLTVEPDGTVDADAATVGFDVAVRRTDDGYVLRSAAPDA